LLYLSQNEEDIDDLSQEAAAAGTTEGPITAQPMASSQDSRSYGTIDGGVSHSSAAADTGYQASL